MDKRPNLLWILSDQQFAGMLSCNGDPNVRTPNLDTLADMGVNCTSAVGGFPLCCPFRGSMLTGRYPHGCVPGHEFRLPPEMPTVADAFRSAGYHTGYIGKWHLDGFRERDGRAAMHIVPPERRGHFDTWIGYENNNSPWDSWVHGGEGEKAFHCRLPGYETDSLTDLLLGYIAERERDGRPFFAVLSVQPPHDPYVAPEEYMRRFQPQSLRLRPNVPPIPRVEAEARRELSGAYAMVENLDFNVGRIREKLLQNGMADHTHVLFFSDHGDMHGSHGQFRKTSPFEEAIRVPFLMGGFRSHYGHRCGVRAEVPLNHVDIAPTSLGLCGLPVPEGMQGTDYSALRLGEEWPEFPDSAYLQSVVPTGHWDSVDRPWRGLVTRDGWKWVCLPGMPWLLYHLEEDPYELMNLAFNSRYAAKRRELNARLGRWIGETGDEFPLPEV